MKEQSEMGSAPIVAAYFDVECGIALVSQRDLNWLAKCPDVTARKGKPWEFSINGIVHGFEVVPVKPSIVANAKPKPGASRRLRHARCGGGEPAVDFDCFPLSTGRFASIKLAGYSQCLRGFRNEYCDETYVKIGDIIIAWDSDCRLVAEVQEQYRWICFTEN